MTFTKSAQGAQVLNGKTPAAEFNPAWQFYRELIIILWNLFFHYRIELSRAEIIRASNGHGYHWWRVKSPKVRNYRTQAPKVRKYSLNKQKSEDFALLFKLIMSKVRTSENVIHDSVQLFKNHVLTLQRTISYLFAWNPWMIQSIRIPEVTF